VVATGDGRGSWAARCAWRHDRHHHLHLARALFACCASLLPLPLSPATSNVFACSFKRPWDFVIVYRVKFWLGRRYTGRVERESNREEGTRKLGRERERR
jgi:hypothetical protein